MTPVLALVGRPNVGKSTLFNVLTRSRDALVAELPGVTRDRRYGVGRAGERDYIVVDTGGLGPQAGELEGLMAQQTRKALEEADVVLFLVDAREGLTAQDQAVAETLRPLGKPVVLVLNKIDGLDPDAAAAEFHALGLGQPRPISAAHRRGVTALIEHALPPAPPSADTGDAAAQAEGAAVAVALIGRPNVGKSTLVNRLLGEERMLASALPGTTRDALAIPFHRGGRDYLLIDTAGVRRRARVQEKVEKFSVIKTLEAIERAQVVVLLLDAREGLAEQDLTLLGHVLEAGRALVIAVNKWDGLAEEQRRRLRAELDRRLGFADFAEVLTISALHGTGVGLVMEAVDRAHDSATRHFATARLTRILEDLTGAHPPPAVRGRRIRLRYAHQGGRNPPVIVVHGNQVERLPDSYRRYLANGFSRRLGLRGTPLRLELRAGENPFAGRVNRLTPRQQRRRKRLLRHAKGGG